MNRFSAATKKFAFRSAVVVGSVAASCSSAFAAFTLPAMPTDQIETAGVAVAGLVIAGVLIGAVLKMVRKAG